MKMNMRPQMSDARLIEMARARDSIAFDALMRRFQRAVHAVAFAVVSDREVALDVLQESFITAYRSLHTLEDPGRFGPWVCAIARNRAKQVRRDQWRRESREVLLLETATEDHVDRGTERVREALSVLTEIQADVVMLFYMEGYSIAECAYLLDVPEGTVERRLHDARQRLKKEMTDMVKTQLPEFALPEDYRVVIDKPTPIHSTGPALAHFKDTWVLIWQDGVPWEPYDGPFWFWLSESVDGRDWSEPRRLKIEQQWQCLSSLCVLGDELVMHTHHHNYGLRIHRTTDMEEWVECPLIHAFDVGRSDAFTSGNDLFVVYPLWRPHEIGDAVEVIKSSDFGVSWTWLNQPFVSEKTGITDAAGIVADGRIVVACRGYEYPMGAGNSNDVYVCCSDDGGNEWSKPVRVEPLCTKQGSFELQILRMPDDGLAIVQWAVPGCTGTLLGGFCRAG